MAGVQPTTILINENMSDSQIASFINQNFQAISSSFLTSAFKIVAAFTATSTAYTTVTASAGQVAIDVATFTLNHNLNFTPAVLAFAPSGTHYYPLPRIVYSRAADNIAYTAGTYQVYTTDTQVTVEIQVLISAIGSAAGLFSNVGAQTYKIFLLQDKAT